MLKQKYPSKLREEAADAIASLPGIGSRSALRLALHLLRQPSENVHHLADSLVRLRDEARYCRNCMMISDDEICSICSDRRRDRGTICVVETVRDVMTIENTGQYHGLYHVLGGIISPMDGLGPSDLTISELVKRVSDLAAKGEAPEVILALSGDVEGETTSFYIYRQLAPYGVKVTTLARGLGFGDALEYADELTLGRSIVNRTEFRP